MNVRSFQLYYLSRCKLMHDELLHVSVRKFPLIIAGWEITFLTTLLVYASISVYFLSVYPSQLFFQSEQHPNLPFHSVYSFSYIIRHNLHFQ